jgi:polysaccharide biosynthesis protein PslF
VSVAALPSPAYRGERAPTFAILSSFPPTSCGIATFSAALAAGLVAEGAAVEVVRTDQSGTVEHPLVAASLADYPASAAAVRVLNASDVVIVQHEYGLYDGLDGDSVLDVAAAIDVPLVVVAHTVLSAPSAHQRLVLERLCAMASAVVVMTEVARDRLGIGYAIDPAKVVVIPHGAAVSAAAPWIEPRTSQRQPRILTWGLLGPGKGIEWAIDALTHLSDLRPRPEYVVAGTTHPKVREQHGESYREMLTARAASSRSGVPVRFDDTYRDVASLTDLIESADVVVLPYDSQDQVTSGVLVDAVAAGRPVVSTAFPHALELLRTGAGLVVPQRDSAALGRALRAVLTEPGLAESMAVEARRLSPELSWAAVARRYIELGEQVAIERCAVTL